MQCRSKQLWIGRMAIALTGLLAAWGVAQPMSQPVKAPPVATAPASQAASQPTSQPATQPDKPVPLAGKLPMSQVAEFLYKHLGKPVLVNKDVEKIEITLVNPKPLALADAMYVLRTALLEQGVAIEERADTVHLVPVSQILSRSIPTIGSGQDLRSVQPPNQFVRKFFDVRHYNVSRLVEVIKPLLPSYGQISADPNTGQVIIVATAEDLLRLSIVIEQMDKRDVSSRELRVFDVRNVDVFEIMPILQKLIAGALGGDAKAVTIAGGAEGRKDSSGGPGGPNRGPSGPSGPGGGPQPSPSSDGVSVVMVQADAQRSVLLYPEPRRPGIVVEGPASILVQIEDWLKQLDQPRPASTDVEIVEVQFRDAEELCGEIMAYLNNTLDEGLRSTTRITPFPGSRKLMIRGSGQNRELVKEWLKDVDVDTGAQLTRTFVLSYGDAQEVADNIKDLFTEKSQSNWYDMYYGSGRSSRSDNDRKKVTVTANIRMNSVTVRCLPETMKRIEEQVESQWDKRFTGDEAAPKVYELKYADPEKVRELLESLFTKKEKSSVPWYWYSNREESTPSPVGRLYGQFRFEAYPDLGKLVVVSKNAENYAIIDRMIEEMDVPQTAGVPRVIQLRYADAEPLAEQLNALLNAPGTPTSVIRRDQTPTFRQAEDSGSGTSPYSSGNSNQRPQQQQQGQVEQGVMRFWWQYVPRDAKEKQPSNLVGKLRIVPMIEQNVLLVTAPEDYTDSIQSLIQDLDKPGCQVLIKAVIAEITHEDATSLGYRFSSDPTIFQTGDPFISENALRGLLNYQFQDSDSHNTVTFNLDVHNLISLLRRKTDIKIRSEPQLFVADNVEGEFFDGQDIPFISNSQSTDVGSLTQTFEYKPVGITLRVRPHITTEGRVALTVNITASSVVPGRTLFGGAIVDRRETNQRVVLEDGRTFMISGMLRREERAIIRRVPGLGDIPGLGELFKHRELADVNTEMLIFLTPHVIRPDGPRDVIERIPLEQLRRNGMMIEDPLGLAPACTSQASPAQPVAPPTSDSKTAEPADAGDEAVRAESGEAVARPQGGDRHGGQAQRQRRRAETGRNG